MKNVSLLLLVVPFLTFAQWNQIGGDIDGQTANDQAGVSSALNGDGTTVIVGEFRNSSFEENSGQIRIFDWDGSNWNQKGQSINGAEEGDIFGEAVAINATGDIIIAGAPSFLKPGYLSGTTAEGYARVYQWDGTAWVQRGEDIFGEAFDDVSGGAVSINDEGTIIAIGASSNGETIARAGHTRIFQWDGVSWNQLGQDIEGEEENAFSGQHLSLNATGTALVIGEPGHNPDGQVRVFDWDGTNWNQRGSAISGDSDSSSFGSAIDMDSSGDTFLVGAFSFSNGALGSVKAFSWNGSDWIQKGATIFGTEGSDFFGTDVAISDNGNILCAGATTGDNGYARVFNFTNSDWAQVGDDIIGESSGDQFGRSVSMNSSGDILAIGTPFNDANGESSGHVRIFENETLNVLDNTTTNIKIYPNPVVDSITFISSQNIYEITIYSVLGQPLEIYKINDFKKRINTTFLNAGTYFAKLKTDLGVKTVKFFKQ